MLPWRRHKFVLVRDEAGRGGKSLRPGKGCSSLLSGLLRPCPHLLAAWPGLGRVFRRRRGKAALSREDPTYTVRYLGSAATLQAKGDGCTDDAVGRIWARCGPGGGTKMKLTLGPHGLRMQPCERGPGVPHGARLQPCGGCAAATAGVPHGLRTHPCERGPAHAYLLRRITHCAADGRRPRVLAWVYRHPARHKAVVLRCHAVLLARARKARGLARLLRHRVLAALSDFQRLQRLSDARRGRQLLLGGPPGRAPPRRLLNAPCAYRPPCERARGSRLGPIREEDEEDERPEVLGLARALRTCSLRGGPD